MNYPRGKRWFTSGTLITPEEVAWPASTLTAQMGSKDKHFVINQLTFTSQDLQQNVQHLSVTEVQYQCWRGHFKRRMSRWGELFINPDQLLRHTLILLYSTFETKLHSFFIRHETQLRGKWQSQHRGAAPASILGGDTRSLWSWKNHSQNEIHVFQARNRRCKCTLCKNIENFIILREFFALCKKTLF